MTRPNPFERDLDRNPANHTPLSPLSLIARTAFTYPRRLAVVHGDRRYTWAETYARSRKFADALVEGRRRRRRHGRPDGRQYSGNDRSPFRGADDGRRAQHPQHAARRGRDRVHARARRGEGARHRHRVFADDRKGAGAAPGQAAGGRHRRRARTGRQAPRRRRLRGVHRRRRPGIRVAASGGRVECDFAQLHVRHHRQPEGCGLPSPRRVSQRAVQHHRLGHAAARGVPVDAADVPLQRLVLRLDDGRQRRSERVPAQGRGEGDLRRHARASRSRTTAARRSCISRSSMRRRK